MEQFISLVNNNQDTTIRRACCILEIMRSLYLLLMTLMWPVMLMAATGFPGISGKTLNNQPINLPNNQHHQLIILGFDQQSGELMEAWVRGLQLMVPTPPIDWVQVPVIGGVPPFVDGLIKRGMEKSIPKEIQGRFFPYFGNKKWDILKSIHGSETLADNATPFIVITAPNGQIRLAKQFNASSANITVVLNSIRDLYAND